MRAGRAAHTTGMKMIRKWTSAVLCAALLLWYGSPPVQRLLCGASVLESVPEGAPLLSTTQSPLGAVSGSGDERLSDRTGANIDIRFLGVLPLRTVETVGTQPVVAASGRAIGIRMQTRGVQIVGLGGIRTGFGTVNPAAEAGLKAGDVVLSVDGESVKSSADFLTHCNKEEPLLLLCERNGNRFRATVTPVRDSDGALHIGVWVRDSTSGIGTLSFYAPESLRFAALGHGVSDVDTGVLLKSGGGNIYPATVTGVERGSGGQAGELIGVFSMVDDASIGTLKENTPYGIAGTLNRPGANAPLYPIASPGEVRLGEAEMRSTVEGDAPKSFRVRVIRLDVQASPETNGFMIEVIDRDLVARTGGIVQGMSGSPVVQNGKVIGVVTHVFLSDSTRGYCIDAQQMYENLF